MNGLGIIQVRKRKARMGRNPATGEAIKIKASKKIAFRVAKDLEEAIECRHGIRLGPLRRGFFLVRRPSVPRCRNNGLRGPGLLRYSRRMPCIGRRDLRPPVTRAMPPRDPWPSTSPSRTARSTATTGGWASGRTWCACGRPRTAARRSSPIRCASRRAALHQLAAGPVRQLPGARRRAGRRRGSSRSTVDLVADMATINPFDFFVEDEAAELAVRLRRRCWPASSSPISRAAARQPLLDELPRARSTVSRAPPSTSSPTSTAGSASDIAYRVAHGAGRADAGGDAGSALGLVPRQRLAAGADAAPPRPRGALRLGLPDPARGPTMRPPTAPAGRPRTSPTCTPGPRSTFPAPAGSASTRPRACSPARATSRWRRRPRPSAPRPITGTHGAARGRFLGLHAGRAHARDAARHQALQRRAVAGDPRRRRRRGRAADGRRRAPQHGRRADLRGARRRRGAGVEHRRARPDQARVRRQAGAPACARASPRAACCTTARASGIRASRRRAGPSRIYWRTDGEPLWRDASADRRGSDRERRRPSPTPSGSPASCAARSDCAPTARFRPTRMPRTSC